MSIELDRRGIDIGRDSYLDWSLPDPERFISGKHCEVRYKDDGYWLHDVSSNGTTVNGEASRITEPYQLKHGDRIHIGAYIVVAELDGASMPRAGAPEQEAPAVAPGGDPWGGVSDSAEGISRRDFNVGVTSDAATTSGRPVTGDLADEEFSWSMSEATPSSAPDTSDLDVGWAAGPSVPPSSGPPQSEPEEAPLELTPSNLAQPASDPVAQPAPEPVVQPAPEPVAESVFELGPSHQPTPEPAPAQQVDFTPEPDPIPAPELAPEPAPAPVPEQPARQGGLAGQWQADDVATPPSEPAPAPAPIPAPTPAPSPSGGDWVAAFERGAGLPAGAVQRPNGDDALAEELGQLFLMVTENLKAMLSARDETKNAMRSSQRTMIQALENNPLKFSPTPEDAMRIMFGEKVRSYLDARQTLEASFGDLKTHQMKTFTAMQQALQALIEDLSPEKIAEATSSDGGLAGLVSSRRAKLWDIYAERFSAKAGRHERGMIDAFMILFAEMYDRQGSG